MKNNRFASGVSLRLAMVAFAVVLFCAGCANGGMAVETEATPYVQAPEVSTVFQLTGNYTDNYAGDHRITSSAWESFGCIKTVISYDNTAKSFIYQEAINAACFNQGKYGKVYWTTIQSDGSFYMCENVYGKNSASEAQGDASPPSSANPSTGGCGGFSWSQMTRNIDIIGNYTDNYAGSHAITRTAWTSFGCAKTIVSFDNTSRTFIYQEANNAACYNQGKFGKVYWTTIQSNGNFYSCENVYGKNSAAEAQNDSAPPSATDPANAGCGGFSWSLMSRN